MRLNSDDPNTMPITDAVYPRRQPKGKPLEPRNEFGTTGIPVFSTLARMIPQRTAERLARRGTGSTRRLVGRGR